MHKRSGKAAQDIIDDKINQFVLAICSREFKINSSIWTFLELKMNLLEKDLLTIPSSAEYDFPRRIGILRSFFAIITLQTNYWKRSKNTKNHNRWSEQLKMLFQKFLYQYEYQKLFKIIKDWYGNILNFNSDLFENKVEFERSWEKFFELIPGHMKILFNTLKFDWHRGRHLEVLYSFNQMKKGFKELTGAQMKETVISTTEQLLSKPKSLEASQHKWLDLAIDLVLKNRSNFAIDTFLPPTEKATYEYSVVISEDEKGGGRRLLKDLSELRTNELEIGDSQYLIYQEWMNNYHLINSLRENPHEVNAARIALLVEANKVRYLTVQSVFYQTYCRKLQKFLSKEWKNSGFSTMDDNNEWINKFTRMFEENRKLGRYHGSADFTDATNLMKPEITKYLIEGILKRLKLENTSFAQIIRETVDSRDFDLDRINFVNHPNPEEGSKIAKDIKTELKKRYSGSNPKQTSGQLMGNPLSFTLLCLANLATYLESKLEDVMNFDITVFENKHDYRIFTDSVKMYMTNEVIINGDDAYSGFDSEEQFKRYKDIALNYGLKVNLKTVFNKMFAQMNNVLISARGKIEYLNLALFFNNNIKNLKEVTLENIGENAMMFNEDIREIYIKRCLKKINKKLPKRMWTVSKSLGGLGMKFKNPAYLSRLAKENILTKYRIAKEKNPKVWSYHKLNQILQNSSMFDETVGGGREILQDCIKEIAELTILNFLQRVTGELSISTSQDELHPFKLDDSVIKMSEHLTALWKYRWNDKRMVSFAVDKELLLNRLEDFHLPMPQPSFDSNFEEWNPTLYVGFNSEELIEEFYRYTRSYHDKLFFKEK